MADEYPDFDLYAELEVSELASIETIQAAYRSLQLRNHPDRAGAAAGERAVRLNIARDWLTDASRRAQYDAHLAALRRSSADDDGSDGTGPRGGPDTEAAARDEPDAEPRAPGILHDLRHHLRIDVRRLGRIWIVGLAVLGATALVPMAVDPAWLRVALAVATVLVLLALGIGLVGHRDEEGLASALAAWLRAVLGWVVLAVLAAEGVTAAVDLGTGGRVAAGVAEVALPAVAATALVSVFAIRRRHGPAETSIDEFLEMTPREFETAVGLILGRHGFRLAVTGGPGDLAADLTGTDPGGRATVVQCKRYAPGHPVGSRDVQLLIAMGLRHHDAEHLVLVTTSDYTDPARDLAAEHDVELISGEELEDLTR